MFNLQFCPNCGEKELQYNGRKMHCSNCGFVFYNNTAAAVAVIIRKGDEILMARRNRNPSKGKLDLAGGFIDFHETAEEAACREIAEELQIHLDKTQLKYLGSFPNIYVFNDIQYHTMDLFYEYKAHEDWEFHLEKDEIAEVLWFKKSEFPIEELAFESQKMFFKEYLKK